MENRRFRPVAWVFVAVVPLAGLQQAVARDCNLNGVPDDCDVNCSLPGCLQYACGRSDDIDGNGIPDECEGAPAIGTFTTTDDFTALGTLINLDDSVPGQLSRSELPRPMPNLWVAASNRGSIVRINTETGDALGHVVGEYFTAPEGRGKNPSRTSVNLDGEVWVSNRSEGSQFGFGSITRIGVLDGGTLMPQTACEPDNRATFAPPFAYNTCVDRNGDGMITTSNGLIPLPWHHENQLEFGTVDTAEDECIISYVALNARNARHISVNKDNDVWVGGNDNNNTFDLVDGETGAILKTFDVGMGGYGGLIDCNDVLWSVSRWGDRGLFWYDTKQDIAAAACCRADLLTDSNNDLRINFEDEAIEADVPGLIVYINDDDDDENGTLDLLDEMFVPGEDDLLEIRLLQSCVSESSSAWWSLSWADAPETLRIWEDPEKIPGEFATPPSNSIVSDVQYNWPPPESVWIEGLDEFTDITIVLTVSPDGSRGTETDTLSVQGKKAFTITLRVVVLVEELAIHDPPASLDFPPVQTGGCKLTQTEITQAVDQMIKDSKELAKGWRLQWPDKKLLTLESTCMRINPAPGLPDNSACSLPSLYQPDKNNPRTLNSDWYLDNIIGQPPGGDGVLLLPGDESHPNFPHGYKDDPCWLNIYFIGNYADPPRAKAPPNNKPLRLGITFLTTDGDHPSFMITDQAGWKTLNQPNFVPRSNKVINGLTPIHEAFCHFFPDMTGHPAPWTGIDCADQTNDWEDFFAMCKKKPWNICMRGECKKWCVDFSPAEPAIDSERLKKSRTKRNSCRN